jgi:hypothetical protein
VVVKARVWGLGRLHPGFMDSDLPQDTNVCLHVFVFCCPMQAEA